MPQASNQSGWTIAEWSSERGRGRIKSDQLGFVDFDAGCADVDDFVVGEPVEVEIDGAGTAYRVKRLWPSNLRLPGKSTEAASVPLLDKRIEEAVLAELSGKSPRTDYRLKSCDGRTLKLEGDDDLFSYGHSDEIEIADVSYIEMPVQFGCQSFRLATPVERSRVATRVDLTVEDVVFTLVEDKNRFHFVVGAGLRWQRMR